VLTIEFPLVIGVKVDALNIGVLLTLYMLCSGIMRPEPWPGCRLSSLRFSWFSSVF